MIPLFAALAIATPAQAQLLNGCTLTLTTNGSLAVSMQGSTLGSQEPNGSAAVMAVVALGLRPTLSFTTPQLSGPGNAGTSVTSMAFSTLSGVNSGYTTGPAVVQLGALIDTVTINAKVVNVLGFRSGSYAITSTVTCQQ